MSGKKDKGLILWFGGIFRGREGSRDEEGGLNNSFKGARKPFLLGLTFAQVPRKVTSKTQLILKSFFIY